MARSAFVRDRPIELVGRLNKIRRLTIPEEFTNLPFGGTLVQITADGSLASVDTGKSLKSSTHTQVQRHDRAPANHNA